MGKKKNSKSLKGKKKKWFSLFAPKFFNEQNLGETTAYETKELETKKISVNLMTLAGDPKKQSTNVRFVVDRIEGNNAYTHLDKITLQPASIKRMVRRGKTKVEDSFLCETQDKKYIRIKPLVFTRNQSTNSVMTAIRHTTRDIVTKTVKNMKAEDVFYDILMFKLQKMLKESLSKIVPIKIVEIKNIELYDTVNLKTKAQVLKVKKDEKSVQEEESSEKILSEDTEEEQESDVEEDA